MTKGFDFDSDQNSAYCNKCHTSFMTQKTHVATCPFCRGKNTVNVNVNVLGV